MALFLRLLSFFVANLLCAPACAPVQARESNDDDADGNALYVRLKKVACPSGREINYIYEAPPTSRLSSISENFGGTQNGIWAWSRQCAAKEVGMAGRIVVRSNTFTSRVAPGLL